MQPSSINNRGLIGGIVAISLLIFGGLAAAIYFAPSDPGTGTIEENVTFDDSQAPSIGPTDAKVVVHMYSDFQCPACRTAEAPLQTAIQKYGDRVRFVWKDFPLITIHKNARTAANAARCADVQGAFWPYHSKLYDMQSTWEGLAHPQDSFVTYARELNLKEADFSTCLAVSSQDAKVMQNVDEGNRNRVESTPTFFINNRRYHGMSVEAWSRILDEALAKTSSTS